MKNGIGLLPGNVYSCRHVFYFTATSEQVVPRAVIKVKCTRNEFLEKFKDWRELSFICVLIKRVAGFPTT